MKLENELQRYFGFGEFRPLQKEVVEAILAGNDCLAILPTGGGKSLCFQLPGLLLGGTTIVVSPLISLMTDQVEHLQKRGIAAVALTSGLSDEEKQEAHRKIASGFFAFVYVSPEKLHSRHFHELIANINIRLVVVDEAHCISEWGHQFRPEYRMIAETIALLPKRPIVAAFTASATPHTAHDILQQLRLTKPKYFRQSVFRPNLSLHVLQCSTITIQHLVATRLLRKHAGQFIIVYCATRRQTEETAVQLCRMGKYAVAYHAGLATDVRKNIQQSFLDGKTHIICATTAFGMGVDKPDIRCVIHLSQPASLEGYYQEVGRAGRDGKPSNCYLLQLPEDAQLQAEILESSFPPLEVGRAIVDYLQVKQFRREQKITIQSIAHILLEQKLEVRMRLSLERGEALGWWQVNKKEKTIQLLLEPTLIHQDWLRLTRRMIYQLQKLQKMERYTTENVCRMRQLLLYFEPTISQEKYQRFRCGQCDVCLPQKLAEPTLSENVYYRKLQRLAQHPKYQVKKVPRLSALCFQVIATHQPLKVSEQLHLAGLGRGWRAEWGTLVEDVPKLRARKTGTTDHPRNHVGDSTREFPPQK